MKKLENKLDQLFRDGLAGSEAPVHFREEDWAAMGKLLDKKPGQRALIIRLGYYLSGIAALFLLAFGLFFLSKNNEPGPVRRKDAGNNTIAATRDNGRSEKPGEKPATTLPATVDNQLPTAASARRSKSFFSLSVLQKGRFLSERKHNDTIENLPLLGTSTSQLVLAGQSMVDSTAKVVAATIVPDTLENLSALRSKQTKSLKPARNAGPVFALSILGAPDLNGVNSFNNGKVGTNISVQLSIRLTRKLSISSGAAYAVKPYETGFAQYNSSFNPAVQPINVAANCKVLDIPVNLNYQFYAKGINSLSFGTGLSSYFMLNEKYRFDYESSSGIPAFNLDISGKNRHLFGVVNFNATYQRKISNQFSAIVQPYIKLPLTGIGNGQVNLKSTGVALGFSWNINPFGKPK